MMRDKSGKVKNLFLPEVEIHGRLFCLFYELGLKYSLNILVLSVNMLILENLETAV